jgi:hypothetical protein
VHIRGHGATHLCCDSQLTDLCHWLPASSHTGLSLLLPALAQHHSQQPARQASNDNWQAGRASFYGLDGGATIHQGGSSVSVTDQASGPTAGSRPAAVVAAS